MEIILMICTMSAGWSPSCAKGYFKNLDDCLKSLKEIKISNNSKGDSTFAACLPNGKII